MLRVAALALLSACCASADVIHGVVLEGSSSRPLARARVKLETLSDSRLREVTSVLANRSGQFAFLSLPAGYYVVSAVRIGFAGAAWGQKRPGSPGALIAVGGDSVTFTELRLSRLGAITGKVVDENRVGLPGIKVLAYAAMLPLRQAGTANSDDRGIYRIGGLPRGRYWVRTAPLELEDVSGLLPTFFPESIAAKEARPIPIDLDREVADVDVQPAPGKLLRLSGRVLGCRAPVVVTLSSDTGRKQQTFGCSETYSFDNLAPGYYELLAHHQPGESPMLAAHQELFADRDQEGVNLQLTRAPSIYLEVSESEGGPPRRSEAQVLARRKDLAGEGETIRLSRESGTLLPGFWELTALPAATHYLASISVTPDRRRASRAGQNDDWYEVFLGAMDFTRIRVALSPRAAKLTGRVVSGADPVPGAPVFLYPAAGDVRRRMNGTKMARADVKGAYEFQGLAPGNYLLLSSFDLDEITEESLTAARARLLSIDEGRPTTQDLTLYQAP